MDDRRPADRTLGGAAACGLLFRSFFLQASWSYDRMQSVGFAAALAGAGRRLVAPEDRPAFLARHLEYFNTNPVLSTYVIGGVLRLEEDGAGDDAPERIRRFKRALAGPLAAWGDTLFWATLRPVAAVFAAAAALLSGAWAVPVYLLAYNVPHFAWRWRGLHEGYRHAMDLGRRLGGSPLRTLPVRIRRAGLLVLGFVAAFSAGASREAVGTGGLLVALAAAAAAIVVLKKRAGLGEWWGIAAALAGLAQAGLGPGR